MSSARNPNYFYSFLFLVSINFCCTILQVQGRPEPPPIVFVPPPVSLSQHGRAQPANSYGAPAQAYGSNLDNMVRQNQLEQQRYLNQQYQLQQQKEQRQMWQQQELDRMRDELLKLKQELESQTLASPSVQYGMASPSIQYGTPAQNLQYGAPAPAPALELAQKPHAEYGAPVVETVEGVEVKESPLEAALNEPVSCDEREQLGHTRIIAVKIDHKICNVKLQTFDRCPGSDPIIVGYDEAEHPGACEGITKFLNVVQFVGNTASRVPGHALRVATTAVDAFDTVKDFYTDLYRKWRQRRKEEKVVVVVKEPEIVKGGYKK